MMDVLPVRAPARIGNNEVWQNASERRDFFDYLIEKRAVVAFTLASWPGDKTTLAVGLPQSSKSVLLRFF